MKKSFFLPAKQWTVILAVILAGFAYNGSLQAQSSEKQLLTFSFAAIPGATGTIDQSTYQVSVTVPFSTDVTSLVATFTSSTGSTVTVGGVLQTSTVTANNFTSTVQYLVTAANLSTRIYYVTVTKTAAQTGCDLLSFQFQAFNPDIVGAINQTTHVVTVTVPYSANVTNLVATFTSSLGSFVRVGGTVQTSGVTANNFSGSVIYRVLAENGVAYQDYTIVVTKAAASNANSITEFRFNGLEPDVVAAVNPSSALITLTVPFSTDLTSLVATFTNSPLSVVTIGGVVQVSGVTANNFTTNKVYRVTAENGAIKDYTVIVSKAAASTDNQILTFSFLALDPDVTGTINQNAKTISLVVPYGTNVTNLVSTFTSSPLSTVWILTNQQVSGTTANNFTSPVLYKCRAESGAEQTYTVTVTVTPASPANQILTFSFLTLEPDVIGTVNQTNKTIGLIVPYTTNVTALVPTFTQSTFATVWVGQVQQTSGVTAVNFSSAVVYTCRAQDGSDEIYTVTVTRAAISTASQMTDFRFNGYAVPAVGTIDQTTGIVTVTVPFSADLSSLVATFTLSPLATARVDGTVQVSGTTANEFSGPLPYIVVAEDLVSTKMYIVYVTKSLQSSARHITEFRFNALDPDVIGVINETNHTIGLTVPFGTPVTALVATFTLSPYASAKVNTVAQTSGTTPNNFANPVTYTVYAENNATMDYTVTVTVLPGSSAKDITYFAFLAYDPDVTCVINQVNNTITGTVPDGTNRAAMVATYTHSANSVVQIQNQGFQQSGLTVNDFRMPVVYEVIAQDNSSRIYTVTISLGPDTTKPVVTNTSQFASNLAGQYVILRSNEATGKVFIIKNTAVQVTIANLEAAVTAGLGRSSYVNAANTDIPVSTHGLSDGTYYTYAIDAAGNMSLRGTNTITILDLTPPTVSVDAQTITNALNHYVGVTSSETNSFVYLIKEGEPQMSKAQLDVAVNAKKGARGLVVAAGVPVNLSVYQVIAGNYHAYAVDLAGNMSNASTNIVSITEASRLKSILSFNFNGLTPPAIGQIIGTDISVVVRVGTDVSALVATFTLSPLSKAYVGAIQQTSGLTPNNFTLPVTYRVEAEDGSTLDYIVTVSFNTGIEDNDWMSAIKAYPNPFSDHLTIEMPLPADRIQVMNTLGQTVADIREPGMRTVEINTSSLETGLYMVRFIRDNHIVGVQKLMRN